MDVQLPNGYTMTDVPEGTSTDEIKRLAIAAGVAKEADFRVSKAPVIGNIKDGMEAAMHRLQPSLSPVKQYSDQPQQAESQPQTAYAAAAMNGQLPPEVRRGIVTDVHMRPWVLTPAYGAYEGFKHSANDLVNGTANLIDRYAPEFISNELFKKGTPEERLAQRKRESVIENQRFGAIQGELPISTALGGFATWMVPAGAGEKLVGLGGRLLGGALERGAIPLLKAGGEAAAPLGRAASFLEKKAALAPNLSPYADYIAKPAITGAAMNVASEDAQNTYGVPGAAAMGAGFGVLGNMIGHNTPLRKIPFLNSARNVNSPAKQSVLNEMYANGIRLTPGMRSGDLNQLGLEATLRSTPDTAQYMANRFDIPNQQVLMKKVQGAMGMKETGDTRFTQDQLASHFSDISKKYNAIMPQLQGSHTDELGKTVKSSFDDLYNNAINYAGVQTKTTNMQKLSANGKPVFKNGKPVMVERTRDAYINNLPGYGNEAKKDYENFKGITNNLARKLGLSTDVLENSATKLKSQGMSSDSLSFDGRQFQDANRYLDEQIAKFSNSGNDTLVNHLKAVKSKLQSAAVANTGTGTLEKFNTLNAQYAATKSVLNNAVGTSGTLDFVGLANDLAKNGMNNSLLTGRANKQFKALGDVARYADVLNNPGNLGTNTVLEKVKLRPGMTTDFGVSAATGPLRNTGINPRASNWLGMSMALQHGLLGQGAMALYNKGMNLYNGVQVPEGDPQAYYRMFPNARPY